MPRFNKKNSRNNKRKPQDLGRRLEAFGRRVGPAALLVLIAVGLPYVVYQGYLFAVTSPYFAVKDIQIEGAEHASRDALLAQARVVPGVNVFDVDEELSARRLEEHPWVAQAHVRKSLPGSVTMTITEHEPAAVALDGADYLLVDDQGRLFKAIDEQDPADALIDALPLITGASRADLEAGDEGTHALIRQALEVHAIWEEMGLDQRARLSELHVDDVLGLSLIVGERGTEVRLGQGRWRERLSRFARVYDTLDERGVDVDYVLIDQDEDIDRVAVGPARARDR